ASVSGPEGRRHPGAHAGRTDPLPPFAPGGARPSHPAHADGLGDQGPLPLPAAVLGGGRALWEGQQPRGGDARHRPPPATKPGILGGFAEAEAARPRSAASRADRRRAVLADLGRYFGPEATRPEAYLEHSWGDDAFARGAYGGFWMTGLWTAYGHALTTPIGP